MENSKQWEKATTYTLNNMNGLKLEVSNFGARIVSIQVPIKNEGTREITVGFKELAEYQKSPYLGATIGRTAGRIADGMVKVGGTDVQLHQNEGTTTLHGGKDSFESVIWKTKSAEKNQVIFEHVSREGTNGFPGNLTAQIIYRLTETNQVIIEYHAKSDRDTLYNPTNHVYFNLTGKANEPVFDHKLQVKSSEILALNENNTMSGERIAVSNTNFDFQTKRKIKHIFDDDHRQIRLADGLDHPFLLNSSEKEQAILESPDKKVTVKMTTDRQSVIIYTIGRWAEGMNTSTGKLVYGGAITLEAQQPPGSEQQKDLPSIILKKDVPFYSQTTYQIEFD